MTISLTNSNWTLKQWKTMIGRGAVRFDFPIQRKPGMWNEEGKSDLIHSILIGFPIPQVFLISQPVTEEMAKENPQLKMNEMYRFVVDGMQRITNVISYINDEWALVDTTDDVYDLETDETFVIAGKKFSEQDPDIQARILGFSLKAYTVDGTLADFSEVENLFLRLNNGVALKQDQKIKSFLGIEVAKRLEAFDTNEYIVKNAFSTNQIKTDAHISAILMYLMLKSVIDKGEKVTSYSITEVIKFAKGFRDKTIQERNQAIDDVLDVFNYGIEILDGKKKVPFLKRANFAVVTMLFDKAKQYGIEPSVVREWFDIFVKEIQDDKENQHPFNDYAGQGTTKGYIIQHKYEVMGLYLRRFLKERDISFDATVREEYIKGTDTEEETAREEVVANGQGHSN